jgi:hypothetical protein
MSRDLAPCRISIRKDADGYWLSIEGEPSALISLERARGPIVTKALDNAIAHGTAVDLAAIALIERLTSRTPDASREAEQRVIEGGARCALLRAAVR